MGLFSFLKGKGNIKGDIVVGLDIGTEIVKAILFDADFEDGKVVVKSVGRVRHKQGSIVHNDIPDISAVVTTCHRAIGEALGGLKKKHKPKEFILGFGGEVVKGATTTIVYQREKPSRHIDSTELKNIIQKVEWKAYEKIKQKFSFETGQVKGRIKLVNAVIVDIRIDGYKVLNPVDFQGREVSISVFNTYIKDDIYGKVNSLVSNLKLNLLSIVSEPYAVARAVAVDNTVRFNAFFIDVGGSVSDITLVRDGILEDVKTLAVGGNNFTQRMSQELGVSLQEAESIKEKYSRGILSREVTANIKKILDRDFRVWMSGIELSLAEFPTTKLFPDQIFLYGGGSMLKGLKEILGRYEWPQNLPFFAKPSINFIKPEDISNVLDKTGMLVSPSDITPLALASYVQILTKNDDMLSQTIKRSMRIVQG